MILLLLLIKKRFTIQNLLKKLVESRVGYDVFKISVCKSNETITKFLIVTCFTKWSGTLVFFAPYIVTEKYFVFGDV